MKGPKALEIAGSRHLNIGLESALLRSLQPGRNLSFTTRPDVVTMYWLRIRTDPIILRRSVRSVKDWLRQLDGDAHIFSRQYCRDHGGPFDLDKVLPAKGYKVQAKAWAHLFSHLVLVVAQFAIEGELPDLLEDSVFYNPANPQEICVAFNCRLNLGQLTTIVEHALILLESLVRARPDFGYMNWLVGHNFLFEQSGELLGRK